MKNRKILIVSFALFLGACANPLNRITSDRYAETCVEAEKNGKLDVAEQACYRSLVNVDIGNLGPELKSQRLYNLARIKRMVRKFEEADSLLKESLNIEEKLSGPSSVKVGRRLAELAMSYGQEDKILEGVPIVQRLDPIADSYSGTEKKAVGAIFYGYSKELKKLKKYELAQQFAERAASLDFRQ